MAKNKTRTDYSEFEAIADAPDYSEFETLATDEPKKSSNPSLAALESFGDTASFGYLPQLRAKAEPLTDRLFSALTGKEVEAAPMSQLTSNSPEYVKARDQASKELGLLREENPKASLAGTLAGAVTSSPLFGGSAAATGAGRIAQAAKGGAVMGLLQNPGDVEGEVSPVQGADRLKGAALGGLIGGATGGAGEAISKAGKSLSKLPEKLEQFGQTKAFKSSGAMLKDFKKAFDKGRVEELGQEMIDSGLVKPGMTFEDVATKSAQQKSQVGERIGQIYDEVKTGLGSKAKTMEDKAYSTLIDAVSDPKIRPKLGAEAFDDKMLSEIDDIVKNKNRLTDPKFLNDIIGELDDKINYSKRANDLPSVQQGYLALRRALKNQLNDTVDFIGKEAGKPELLKELKSLNKRYGNLSEISSISKDRVARENANRMFGLTDTILASGGAAGGLASSEPGKGVEGALKGAAYGAALGGANKLLRTYGNPILSTGATKLGSALQRVPSPVSEGLIRAGEAIQKTPSRSGALVEALLKGQNFKPKKGLLDE